MEPLTIFTWGYWGWGTTTAQLIKAVDAVEASRGYEPPMFIDIRISRSVRAPGFNGRAFEKTIGETRYRWMDALGNVAVKQGGSMRIKDPGAASALLEIADGLSRRRQRVLFVCSCEFPGVEGDGCHRTTVARFLLEAASRRQQSIQVVEWSGGEPRLDGFELRLSESVINKLGRGATSIPLEDSARLADIAAVPWLSVVSVYQKEDDEPAFRFVIGPARYKKQQWYFPIHFDIPDDMSRDELSCRVQELRKNSGFEPRNT